MATGTIKRYFDEKGFGFIKPDAAGTDIFFHVTALPDEADPKQGQRVSYEIAPDSKSGKSQAVNLKHC